MRYLDFKTTLTESGIGPVDLKKYAGKYLDVLIGMINTGQLIELEGPSRDTYGKKVKFQPSDAEMLSNLFYGTPTVPDDKSEVNVDDRGFLIPVNKLPRSIQLTIDGTDNKVSTANVYKTPEMKGGTKDFNTGDVGEAFLGAATVAKFQKVGETITEEDVLDVLSKMEVVRENKNKRGTLTTTSGNDKVDYVLVLNQTSFSSLQKSLSTKKLAPQMVGLNRSSVEWANTSSALKEAINISTSDPQSNKITVNSDGVSDQKGTKADLFLSIDENTIELLSAKAGDVKQFGQVPGNSYEKVQTLFKSIFGINISDRYIEQMNGSVAKDNYPIFKEVYKDVADALTNELQGNTPAEVKFVKRLYTGISHHASLNDPKVSMVILKATPNSPGFTELTFGPELAEAMEQFDLQVVHQMDPPKIQIHGRPIGTEAIKEVKGDTLLIQVRTNMKGDSSGGYIRSVIEMGKLLKSIAKVEYEVKNSEPTQPAKQ